MSMWLQSQCPVVKLEIENKLTMITDRLPFRVPLIDIGNKRKLNRTTEGQKK